MELDSEVYNKVQELCDEGDDYADGEEFDEAIDVYFQALQLIPEPVYDYAAATWIYVAIGDAFFFLEKYDEALDNFMQALKCPDAIGNPFIVLRIGQCFYELKDMENAKKYLLQAYMIEGDEIFEEQEEKYFALISGLI